MGYQRITPEIEEVIGVRLRASALAGGHRGKLPPDFGPQYDLSKTSLKQRAFDCVGDGEITSAEVADRLGVQPHQASGILSTLCGNGRLIFVRRVSVSRGNHVNVYKRAGTV